jgi:hypothetical protein
MTNPADELRLGDWNIRCDRCGKKMKGSEARRTWEGYYVCQADWEPRHPQDFVRAVPENPTPAFIRNPPDVYLGSPVGIVAETYDWMTEPFNEPDYITHEGGVLHFITEA